MAFMTGVERDQMMFTSLDEMLPEDSPARPIDAFVESLDLGAFGFAPVGLAAGAGRPAYDPKSLLKLLIWGYRNNVRSSRKLEAACRVNVEAMWLAKGLRPEHSTIAGFRRANAGCFKGVFRELARRLSAEMGSGYVSVDGTKVAASNSKDRNFTAAKLDDRISWIGERAEEYMRRLEAADRLEDEGGELPVGSLTREDIEAKLAELRERLERYEGYRRLMEEGGLSQLSLTDADSRLMRTAGGFVVGFNVQAAVDSESHLIVNYLETDRPTDHGLLAPVAAGLVEPGGILEVTADKGYVQAEDMLACLEAGVLPSVIAPDGTAEFEIEVDYEPAEGADPASTDPAELSRCIRAGIVPDAYRGLLSSDGVSEKRRLVRDAAAEAAPERTEEEMRTRAAEGYFVRDPGRNLVWCPAGAALRQKCVKRSGKVRYANKTACKKCALRDKCGTQKCGWKEVDFGKDDLEKPIKGFGGEGPRAGSPGGRYERSKVAKFRLRPDKRKCDMRKCLSEHPFGTIKRAMGADHFLLRGMENVGAEFGLMAMGYNLSRAVNAMPFGRLMEVMG